MLPADVPEQPAAGNIVLPAEEGMDKPDAVLQADLPEKDATDTRPRKKLKTMGKFVQPLEAHWC